MEDENSPLPGDSDEESSGDRPLSASAAGYGDEPESKLQKLNHLSAARIFRNLSARDLLEIETVATTKVIPRGTDIYTPGETGDALLLLHKGRVNLYRLSAEGRKLITQVIGPTMFFGELSVMGRPTRDHFAQAAEHCLVSVIPGAELQRLILKKPEIALRMMEEISQRVQEAHEALGMFAFKSIPARIASLLMRLSEGGSKPVTGTRHQDIADMLGIYRETVSTTLGNLREDEVIEMSRREIVILNAGRLREIAEGEILRRQ
jgi:CRP-like cAMP-binding protein